MGSPNEQELRTMIEIARDCNCNYVLETGCGASTACFVNNGIRVVTIDVDVSPEIHELLTCLRGWSITEDDMVKKGHPLFRESRYKNTNDEAVAMGTGVMKGETDLLRKCVAEYGAPDFFFCDTGEYCGIAEWRVMQPLMKVGSHIALHDIHYPKSIKNFQVYNKIRLSNNLWEIVYKSNSRAGLCIARKLM